MSLGVGLGVALGRAAISYEAAKTRLLAEFSASSLLSPLDVLYPWPSDALPANYTNQAAVGKNLTATGTVSLASRRGIFSDGSTGYLTGLGAPNSFTNYTQDSAHFSVFVVRAGNQIAQLGRTGTTDGVVLFTGPTTITARINAASSDSWNVDNGLGLTTIVRSDANTVTAYRNGVSLGDRTKASAPRSANALSLLRASTNYCTDTVALFMMGGGITPQQEADRYAICARFMASLGWPAVPSPVTSSISALSTTTLPNASGGTSGKGFTCTGLARDPLDGTWWAGNDGRGDPGDTTFAASVVHLSADFTTVIADYPVSAMTAVTPNDKMSVQGIDIDTSGTASAIRFYIKDTTGTGSAVVKMTRAGVDSLAYTDTASGGSLNGLAYDSINDRDITSGTAGWNFRNKTTGAVIGDTVRTPLGPDQLRFDAVKNRVLVSGGANGVAGNLWVYDCSNIYNFPILSRTITLNSTYAVEGFFPFGDIIYTFSDEYFHNVGGKLNVVQTYPASALA